MTVYILPFIASLLFFPKKSCACRFRFRKEYWGNTFFICGWGRIFLFFAKKFPGGTFFFSHFRFFSLAFFYLFFFLFDFFGFLFCVFLLSALFCTLLFVDGSFDQFGDYWKSDYELRRSSGMIFTFGLFKEICLLSFIFHFKKNV